MFNKFIKLNIKTEDDNLIRPAYYGGRCEVFGNPIKGDFVFHYDFSGYIHLIFHYTVQQETHIFS
jgi:hypothetical protein